MARAIAPRAARPVLSCVLAAMLAALAVAPARATIDPKARAVVDRYVQAIGGPAAIAPRSVHTVSTLQAFMMTGRVESWTVRPDRSASRVEIGPMKMSSGTSGANAWRTDLSGKVVRLDGKDLDDARGGAWFDSDAWLEPDQGGGTVTWKEETSDSTGRYAVLTLQPPVGNPRTAWFDQKSGLLVRSGARNDQTQIVTRLSDYRPAGGRLVAYSSVTEVVGQPMNTVRMTLDSVTAGEPIPDSRFAPPEEQVAAKYLKTPGLARLPFEYVARHVWIKASVNGQPPVDFIFDTGASATVLDSSYAAKIGIRTVGEQQGQGAGAMGRVAFAVVPKLQVVATDGDGVELDDVRVAVLSVNALLAPYFWRDCAGVVGFDFISRFVDEVDYDRHVLTLRDPATFRYEGKGAAIPMTLANAVPVVPMRIDGVPGEFRVDVGSGSTVDLHSPFVKKHGFAQKAARSVDATGGGFGGTFTSRIVRLDSLAIGPFAWKEPLVSLSEATVGAFASEDYAGNIGNRLLERFKVTLDYERRQLWLEPGALYGRRDPMTRTGVQLARESDTVRVMEVLAGSPAERAGVRRHDVVTQLDGRPVETYGPDGISQVLDEGPEGSEHTLTVIREGKPRAIKIRLKEML